MRRQFKIISAYLLSELLILASLQNFAYAENASDYISVPPLINTSSSGDKPNVLFILDNSNSMDEAPSGQAVGSANAGSKSEIARNAIEGIIDTFSGVSRMGLMAYRQSGLSLRRLHDSQYDVSYNPANYDPGFVGNRASTTKKYRVPNPASSGDYIHYNIALPFYANSNFGSKFCYSSTASFDNGLENEVSGPWDTYACYSSKTGTSDANQDFSSFWTNATFLPTDSDFAQNILDFGTNLTWQYVSQTWFSNSSPGSGYLHVAIDDVDSSHKTALKNKLAVSQFSSSTDTPLRNAGLTPIEGSLRSARNYFSGSLPGSESFSGVTPATPPANVCAQQDYVILVTDGLPSVDASGNLLTDPHIAISQAATEAANLLAQGIKTYVIGFGLPAGVDGSLLNAIAIAGGTGTTYLAGDADTLNDSLQSIFLSFSNRDASSSSSAVLANNSRGEGAIFQAVYSPEKEDALGNKVSWVGSLFGLFLDENGYIREDTNQNGELDGYATDRVADYYFDVLLGKTQVNLFTGPGASTPPDIDVDTPSATVDVEDLRTIWEARDGLSSISDVLTQRPYSSNASSGRYIISSVDGENTIDFMQVSDAQIDALANIQTQAAQTLADAQTILNVAQAQYDGALQAVTDMVNQRDAAQAERDAAQADVDAADAILVSAAATLPAAQSNLSAAQDSFNISALSYTSNYTTRYDGMVDAVDAYQTDLGALGSISSEDEFDALVTVLINEGANTLDPDVVSASADLTTAEGELSNALSNLNGEITDFIAAADQAEQDHRNILSSLALTGTISGGDRTFVLGSIAALFSGPMAEFEQANTNFSVNNIVDERDAYVAALINTGVNANLPQVRNAIDIYDAARIDENAAQIALHSDFSNSVYDSSDTFFEAQHDLIDRYDTVAAAQNAVNAAQTAVNTATANLVAAQDILDDDEEALTEAESQLTGAQELLVPVEDSYNIALSAYNSALAAYNQATATVNNSDTLINYLDVSTVAEAYNVVKFVRGEDGLPGLRSRTIDFDNDSLEEVWRLGDIVHSSPVLVGAPDEGYDSQHGDRTYAAFREQYKNRRQVLYVGSNGGMLHAFNAGFWDLGNKSFETTDAFAGGGSVTPHPLGTELWSYVPRAALPHLQWMTDPNYAHTYYVDGDPIAFDANIFSPDATHPFGWGTVLMVGMRFGGGPIDVDADADGTDDTTLRSSYMLFDVTDPELAPTLIAEISDPNLGFTTSVPTVIKKRVKAANFQNVTQNEWYVAFGSGPTDLSDASSTQSAGLFIYDLKNRVFLSGYDPLNLEANSFIGDITSFDDGSDFVDDTLYFGVTGGTPSGGSDGLLKRTRLDMSSAVSTSTVINTSEPVVSAPTVINDQFGRRWITYGTGRLFMAPDNITTQARHYYGVMEPVDTIGAPTWSSVSPGDLENVTAVDVLDTGEISRGGLSVQIPSGTDVDTFDELIIAIREHRSGWKRELVNDGTNPSSRSLSKGALGGNVLFFTSYKPSTSTCQPEGTSRLYGVDMRTGTAIPFEVFDVDDDPLTAENEVADAYILLGQGLASAPIVLRNSSGATVFTSKSTTEQINTNVRTGVYRTGRQSWRQIILD